MISGKLLDCVDYVEEFGAIGPPVSRLPLYQLSSPHRSLQERALKLSTPPVVQRPQDGTGPEH
ncbi:hypothetical protein FVEG_15596 [Fusarium verticillioides 7600]|uniref:Uncharacterized protein n=1 Tax=Gibberella moniliformis (strain M3125 / FGSC 7600) TaxID=334819 RepID=W7MG67_GIBM7|nr:hypothetical protein FVEG_15596 [Fusarium verticillioides 7600]EWG43787.1 hypothetical protein FVEG_15596 [Fusarium verticillioides 7600]